MDKLTPAQKRLVSYLKKRDPKLGDKDIPSVLNNFKRFVKVVQKVYTEPQAQISIKEVKEGDKVSRHRIITTDLEEFKKVFDKDKPRQNLTEVFNKFHKSVTKDKYGR